MTRRRWAAVYLTLLMLACLAIAAFHWRWQEFDWFIAMQSQPAVSAVPNHWPAGAVNVNTANEQELDTLQGISRSQIEALLLDRENRGPFDFPEDLIYVKGIGEKTLLKLYDQLDFSWRNQ